MMIISGRHGSRLQDHLQRRLDERKQRQRGRLASGSAKHCGLKMKGVNTRAGPSTVTVVTAKPVPSVFRPPPPVIPAAQSILGMLESQNFIDLSFLYIFIFFPWDTS
jgi:hypothetical protein